MCLVEARCAITIKQPDIKTKILETWVLGDFGFDLDDQQSRKQQEHPSNNLAIP